MSLDFWIGVLAGVIASSLAIFTGVYLVIHINRHNPGPATWTRTDTEALHAILRGDKDPT